MDCIGLMDAEQRSVLALGPRKLISTSVNCKYMFPKRDKG